MLQNIEVMVVLMLIVLVGYVAGRRGYMDDVFSKKFSNLIVDITCPALILSSTMGDQMPDRRLIVPLLIVGTLTYVLLSGVAFFLPRHLTSQQELHGVMGFALMFGNVGFIGYPIVSSIFGPEAVFYAALLNVPNTLFVFVVGSLLIRGDGGEVHFSPKTLVSTPMLAAYMAILIVALGIDNVPTVISRPLTSIGAVTVPGALLIIGFSMSKLRLSEMMGSVTIYVTAFFRLIVIPVFFFFLFRLLGFSPLVVNINTVIIGMPVAAYGTIFCLKYGVDAKWMTEVTFITTLLAIVTVPVMSMLISLHYS